MKKSPIELTIDELEAYRVDLIPSRDAFTAFVHEFAKQEMIHYGLNPWSIENSEVYNVFAMDYINSGIGIAKACYVLDQRIELATPGTDCIQEIIESTEIE